MIPQSFFHHRNLPAAIEATGDAAPPDDSMRGPAIVGWAIVVLFFGVIGGWAVTAPLNGAVVAQSVVKVDGNRKSVQHLDGGIVKELRVKEGDHVNQGDVLVVLDDSQARAEYQVLSEQFYVLRATEERLRAELNHVAKLEMPADFKAHLDNANVVAVWNGQVYQFQTRAAALEGQRKVIGEKIAQLESQIRGGEAQVRAYREQLISVKKEMDSIQSLVKDGLIARPRYLQLERSGAALQGQEAETEAGIARFRQAIAEQQQQMAQLDSDRASDVSKDLRDTQAKLLEVIPRMLNAQAVLGRMQVHSPYAGRVVALNVFSVGGVINRGDKILDIVPDQDSLVIESQINVDDISLVHTQMRAEIHLTAYKQRITPIVHGDVIQVSADRLTEPKTGAPYYTALVKIDENELAELPNVRLYPGMSAIVMIPTVERTAFDYLVDPLVMSFKQAFRQQ